MHSPKTTARIVGVLYLLLALFGPFSMMYVAGRLIVPGDAEATATTIMASEGLFRAGILSDAIIFLIEIVLSALLYVLLRPVSKPLALAAAFARLAMTAIQGINLINYFAVLLLLGGSDYLKAFAPEQLHSLALLFLNLHGDGVLIWQAFFGLHCLFLGYLVYTSGYFPRLLGILLVLAAFGYLADSLGNFLLPQYEELFGLIVAVTAFTGELSFTLWLLIKGVNPARVAAVSAAQTSLAQ
jgi:hypothetical protein